MPNVQIKEGANSCALEWAKYMVHVKRGGSMSNGQQIYKLTFFTEVFLSTNIKKIT